MCLLVLFINEEKLYFVIMTSVVKEKTTIKNMGMQLNKLKSNNKNASIHD